MKTPDNSKWTVQFRNRKSITPRINSLLAIGKQQFFTGLLYFKNASSIQRSFISEPYHASNTLQEFIYTNRTFRRWEITWLQTLQFYYVSWWLSCFACFLLWDICANFFWLSLTHLLFVRLKNFLHSRNKYFSKSWHLTNFHSWEKISTILRIHGVHTGKSFFWPTVYQHY